MKITFSRNTLIVVLLAVLVGIFYSAPQFLIWQNLSAANEQYVGVQLHATPDVAHFYMPRAREVYDGHLWPGDLFFDEGRLPLNPAPPLLMGGFIALFGGNVNAAYIAAMFFFSALIFLVFYFLGKVITKSNLWGYLIGLIGNLTPIALLLPRAFFSVDYFLNIIVKNFYPLVNSVLPYIFLARFDYPLLTEIFYIPAIIFLYLFWQNPSKKYAIFTAVFTGLLFYAYFHYWVFLVIVLGVLFIYTLIFQRTDKNKLRNFLLIFGILAIISIPYWVNYFSFLSQPGADDYTLRLGHEVGRGFRFLSVWPYYLVYLILALVVCVAYKKRDFNKAVLFWLILFSAFIVFNIQLVTGFVPFPAHFHRAISPFLFLIIFVLLYDWLALAQSRKPAITKIILALLIGLISLLIVKKAVNIAMFINPPNDVLARQSFPADIADSWNWINENIKGEPQIISNSFLTSVYLSIYTSTRPFLPHSGLSVASNFDIEQRYLLANKLFGASAEVVEKRLSSTLDQPCQNFCNKESNDNLKDDYFYLYMLYFRDKSFDWAFTSSDKSISTEKIEELVKRYKELDAISWSDIDAEYVYYGPWEKQFSDTRLFEDKNLELVYRNESVEIYSIIKNVE